jgi:hypothetical protein
MRSYIRSRKFCQHHYFDKYVTFVYVFILLRDAFLSEGLKLFN